MPALWSMGVEPHIKNWLYGPWNKDKYDLFKNLYSIPLVDDYFDYLLDQRNDEYYMDRNFLDYDDIKDPRKLSGTGSTARFYGNAYRMVSRNVEKLYR